MNILISFFFLNFNNEEMKRRGEERRGEEREKKKERKIRGKGEGRTVGHCG